MRRGVLVLIAGLTAMTLLSVGGWGAEISPYSFMGVRLYGSELVALRGQGAAWWEFVLPASFGHHVLLEIQLWAASTEPELKICLAVKTPASGSWRPFCPSLSLIGTGELGGLYSGQLLLARRDFGLGSQLSVKIYPYSAGFEKTLWVDARSVAVLVASPAGGGSAWENSAPQRSLASYRPPASSPVVYRDRVGGENPPLKSLPDTGSAEDASWLAPGVYQGTVGRLNTCRCQDKADWFKVNLQPGQTVKVTLRVVSGEVCGLALYDPQGRKVASVAPGKVAALEYWADERGQWYLEVFTPQGTQRESRYTLLVEIRDHRW